MPRYFEAHGCNIPYPDQPPAHPTDLGVLVSLLDVASLCIDGPKTNRTVIAEAARLGSDIGVQERDLRIVMRSYRPAGMGI